MPHYFFHLLHSDHHLVHDDDGTALNDDTVARREGMISLGELMAEASFSKPTPFSVSVQIERAEVGIIDVVTGHLTTQAQP